MDCFSLVSSILLTSFFFFFYLGCLRFYLRQFFLNDCINFCSFILDVFQNGIPHMLSLSFSPSHPQIILPWGDLLEEDCLVRLLRSLSWGAVPPQMSDCGEVTAQVEIILSLTKGLAPGTGLSPACRLLVCRQYSPATRAAWRFTLAALWLSSPLLT